MNIPLHIFKKDLRHTRILMSLWLAMVLVQFSLVAIGVNPSDHVMQAVYAAVGYLMPMLTALVVIVIIPLVVHGEPLVGTTAFWFTRPVDRPALLCAKAFYALSLVSVPLVVELIILAVNGATLRQLALAFPEILMGSLSLVLAVAVLAALTPKILKMTAQRTPGVVIHFPTPTASDPVPRSVTACPVAKRMGSSCSLLATCATGREGQAVGGSRACALHQVGASSPRPSPFAARAARAPAPPPR